MCHKLVASMDRGATNLDVLNNHVILAQLRQRGIRFFKAECCNFCIISFPLMLKIVLVTF